ncbi:hypothetical protein K8B33_14300 [Alcanivorax sp. JB21]|uniref:hypothetical protein n=1 Tax=Alcanivorax limicola TaxID=2874102 RepID=UPI001CBB8513|nr:hypothetical protein [Alcanivorax limicola]MBZ2190277.1 hypothetical protein [Alcanivorax limicola]
MPKDKDQQSVSVDYRGRQYTVVHCDGALDTFREALKHVKVGKAKSLTRQMIVQIKRLADGEAMSRDNFPLEGMLPALSGQRRGRRFRALKKIPIRGYCWKSDRVPDTWFISHYIYKNKNDLDDRDTEKVSHNWRRIEEDGDER